jgi:nucleoside-diphosphate-sugar epimerase
MNLIVTGATGILGSQILIELLKNNDIEKIHLLIRDKKHVNAKERFSKLIKSDAFSSFENIEEKVVVYDPVSFLKPEDYLTKDDNNYFIHSAGFVNLTTDEKHRQSIFDENLEFTKKLFGTFKDFISKFTYISTAFAIGEIGGTIQNDYHTNTASTYRNAYEESKHLTEKFLLQEKNHNIPIQILRPSVLGGNIYSNPKYYISKYLVYYLLGKFFYKNPLLENSSIRISANIKTGLNIIPTDYVAKVISKVFLMDIAQLNIVHNTCTNLSKGIGKIMEAVNFKNYTIIDNVANEEIKAKNKIESYYYATIGNHLSSYLLAEPYEFDTEVLDTVIPIPKYNLEEYLGETIKYAMQNNFKNEPW